VSVDVTNLHRVCLRTEKEREELNAEGGPQEFQDHTDFMDREFYLNEIQSSAHTAQQILPT
jgi:hypothetical protein